VVLNLVLIGLGITLEPFPLTAFILLSLLLGLWLTGNSLYYLA